MINGSDFLTRRLKGAPTVSEHPCEVTSAAVKSGIIGGALAAVLTLTSALSYAVLIFNGDLASGLGFGITVALLPAVVLSAALVLFGSMRFQTGTPIGNTAAVIAVAAASIARTIPNDAHASLLPTVLVAIAISTSIVGLALFLLGVLRAGRWMRFIPYPVVGGVLGAAGWLFMVGSVSVIGTASHTELAVGLGFSVLLVAATMRVKHPLVLPALLASGVACFYIVLALRGISVESARGAGWFLNIPHASAFVNPWADLQLVRWAALGQHFGDLLTLLVVGALSVLLNTSGLELATRSESDLDRELQVQGVANVACGMLGGLTGVGGLSNTLLSYRIAGPSRIPPIVLAVTSLAVIFGGTSLVAGIPRFVFGALIFTTGFAFLYEWCVRTARRLPLHDYLSILAIVAVVVRFGYVAGVLCGVLIGCIIFVVTYSRINVIKHNLSGAEFRSSVLRGAEDRALLATHGHVIRILSLQGFIFFGMADRLYRAIKALLDAPRGRPEYLILDFRDVIGLDSSAASSFAKIRQVAERDSVTLIFSSLATDLERRWRSASPADAKGIVQFRNLDGALEYCENDVLARYAQDRSEETTMQKWLQTELGDEDMALRLIGFLERRALSEGELLCEQGTTANEMFFIEQGRVGVTVGNGKGTVRLRSLGERTILGEMGLYRSRERTASVVAEQTSVVYVLSRAAFTTMERDDPSLAASFNAAIVRTLADRLEFESTMVASLQR